MYKNPYENALKERIAALDNEICELNRQVEKLMEIKTELDKIRDGVAVQAAPVYRDIPEER